MGGGTCRFYLYREKYVYGVLVGTSKTTYGKVETRMEYNIKWYLNEAEQLEGFGSSLSHVDNFLSHVDIISTVYYLYNNLYLTNICIYSI